MDSDMALTELQEHELPEAVIQDDEDDVEELRNSLREVVQDQSVKPKLQCLMADPTFSMVTVQSEDSGIVWETASSRCSTPWASEASYSSDTYSLDGSATGGGGAQGKITIVFDEDKIIRRRKRTRGKARLGERLRRPGSSRSGSTLGVERPEMAEVSVPNIRVESVESDTESGEVKDKDQELFSLISEGYEILNIKVPSKLPTVDEEESTELQDNLSYLEETPRIRSKSRRGSEALPTQDYPEMKEATEGEEVGESKPSEPTEQQGPHSHKDGTSDMDYFEAFTLLDEVVPGQQVPEPVGDETPTKPQREEPNLGQMTATDSLSAAPDDDFVFVTDMEIASERLDEVFYGNKHHAPPEDLMKRGEEDEEEGGKEGRRESLRSLKESGSALFSREESILTPIFLSPGPPKIIDPILLEEPTAMSFLYSDLYEDAMGERRRSDEEGSEAESVGSDRSFRRRLSDSEETDGYLEKFILKDETPNVEDQSEEADGKGEGLMMWSQSKFELTGFLTRVVEEEEEEKEECKKDEIKDAEMNGYLQPAGYKEITKSTEMEESTEKSLLHIKETGPDKDSESINTDSKVTGKRPEKVDVVEEAKSETTPEAHESEVDSQEEVVSDKVSHETEQLAQAEEVKKRDEVEVSRVAKPVVIQEPVVVQVNQVTTESKTETVVKASEPVRAEGAIKDPTEAIAGAQELHRVSQKAVTDLSVVIVKVSDDTKMASEIAAEAINRMEMLAEAHKVEKVENRSEEPVSVEEESFTHNPEAEVVPTAPPAEAADRWSSPLAPAEGDKGQEEEPMKKQDLDGEDEWVFTPLRSFAPQEDLSVLHRETVVSEMELHTDAGVTERELHRETAEELEYEIISQQEAREMMVSETERKQLCPGPNSNLERERELEKEKEREMELERERKKQRLKEEERQKREGKERQEKEKQMELERERERERLRLKEAKERQEKERQVEKEREKERQARERTIELERERERERQRLKEEKEKERQERDRHMELERKRERERQRLKEESEEKERQERERERQRLKEEKERQVEREREKERQRLKEEREERERQERERQMEKEREKERQRLKEEKERQEKERQEREIQIELERERENERQRLKEREEKERQERERQERERQIELEREREKDRQRLKEEKERQERERERQMEREREKDRQRLKEEKERQERAEKERHEREEKEREREREREREKEMERLRLNELKEREEKKRQEREERARQEKDEKERQERERERERENERQERERQIELEREREKERQRLKEEKERQEKERQMEKEREKDRQRLKEEKERQERQEKERQEREERERERERLKEVKEREEREKKERQEREEKKRQMELLREREMESLRLKEEKERQEREKKERQEREREREKERERQRLKGVNERQEWEEKERQEKERQMELLRERERERLRLKEEKERQEREEKERERERQEEKERHERESQKEEKERRERQKEEKERHERERQMEWEREIEMKRLKEVKEREEREREREMQRLKEVKKTQERERQEREDKEKQMELLREEERQGREEREQKERQEREGKEIQEREKERDNQRLKEKERQERKSEMELVLEGEKQKERVRENLLMDMERQKEREMEERVREERGLDLPTYEEPIEADYEIFDAEEESQARAAAALQGMDCFCLGCGCLLSETDRLSGGHQDHEVTSVETAYEDIKERLSEWISELQERSENIEDLVSELELGYNTVEDHCRDSEEVMEAQNEEMMALVMEQYNTMSLSMEEEKKAKLEQLYDQIVSFQESIDQTKVTLDTTAREAEIDPDTQTSKDIYMRLTEALRSAMSLELGPRGLLVFEDYAKGNAANTHTRRKGIPVPQKPSLQPQECASASSTSVTVYWRVNPGDIIDCFQVYCMEDPQGAVSDEYRVTVKESYCVLEELEPDKVYKVWVMAVNYTGCSLPSERLPFRTAPSVPVIDTGRCTILWDSATLRWNVDNRTPTQSYTLEYCRQYALEGEGLRSISGIQGRQQRVLLHPNENYLFYIKAVNKAGASEQSEAALISTRGTRFHLLKASAHPVLKLSEDQTTLYYPQDTYTERGDVVNECPSVLGELLPMRGHHYWETNVTRSSAYRVGVAYETANRDSLLGENSESWCLHCVPTPYSCRFELLHGSVQSDVFVGEVPSHIGTLLDYKHGRLSFYNTQRGQLLGTLAHCFTQPCHPVLGMEQPGSLKVSMALEVADFAKHS